MLQISKVDEVHVLMQYQGGDDYLIVEYGNEQFDLNHR